MTRAGFVALAGRPNVGKSTLVNAVVGERVAIVSDRAQTTRRAIRGVRTERDSQIVLVDLPGVQRPRDALTARMAQRVREELQGADAVLLLLSGEQGVGAGDRFIARALLESGLRAPDLRPRAPDLRSRAPYLQPRAHDLQPSIPTSRRPTRTAIAVNKVDRLSRAETLEALRGAAELGLEAEVFAISARTGEGVGRLVEHLQALLPEGPFMFAPEARSDQPLELLVAELIREAAIRRTFQELPHALEVVVEAIERASPEVMRVSALIWVESSSQKGIVIGAAGRKIKAIGGAARGELEAELGSRVYLDLMVRVRRDWRRDESLLDRLGIG